MANSPASRDVVDCGDGTDTAVVDILDDVAATCEVLGQELDDTVPVPEPEVDEGSTEITIQQVVYADNHKDRSYLQNRDGGPPADDRGVICDHSDNGRKAVEKLFYNPTADSGYDWFRDKDGAGGDCWKLDIGYNSAGHSTAVGFWNGNFHGVGRRDPHGG